MEELRAAWRKQSQGRDGHGLRCTPVPGLSVAGGFKLMVEDRAGLGLATLQQQTDALIRKLQRRARADRRLDAIPLKHAAALSGYRSHEGGDAGRLAR